MDGNVDKGRDIQPKGDTADSSRKLGSAGRDGDNSSGAGRIDKRTQRSEAAKRGWVTRKKRLP